MAQHKIDYIKILSPVDKKFLELERRVTELEGQQGERMNCDRCGELKPMMQMGAIFDGGTSIICSDCRKKVKEAD